MGRHNSVESLSRMLQIVKLLGKDGGATVTQIADATGIDRWTVRNMIDSLEEVDADGRSFCIEEYKNPDDNRQTYYQFLMNIYGLLHFRDLILQKKRVCCCPFS